MIKKLTNLALYLESSGAKREAFLIRSLMVKMASNAGEIFMHIGGPSGSGKSSLMERIEDLYPEIVCKDLDEFDEAASESMGLPVGWKRDASLWTQEIEDAQFLMRQNLLDKLIRENSGKKIILVGHHTEWSKSLKFNAKYKVLLNTSPEESLQRRIKRDKKLDQAWNFWDDEDLKASELEESKRIVYDLKSQDYISLSTEEVLNLLEDNLAKTATYNKPRVGRKRWSINYKKKINCSNPKGFSQKQYCRRKKNGGKYKS